MIFLIEPNSVKAPCPAKCTDKCSPKFYPLYGIEP